MCLSVNLSVCVRVWLVACLLGLVGLVCLAAYLFVRLFACLFVRLFGLCGGVCVCLCVWLYV